MDSDFPVSLRHPFRIIAFDWDGTAVESRGEDTSWVRASILRLLELSVPVVVITGTHLGNIAPALAQTIAGPSKRHLYISTNRGSEVYGYDTDGRAIALWKRSASKEEDRLLTAVADMIRDELVRRTGLPARVIHDRLNRRKIDLIPLPEWAAPPKSEIGRLLESVEARLKGAGIAGGLREIVDLARQRARENGLPDARITTDAKHLEVGLTDKAESMEWIIQTLARPRGIVPEDILVVGDEFGPIAGFEGSDERMMTLSSRGTVFVSVGPEPGGVPAGVLHVGGGPAGFRALLELQADLHERTGRLDLPGKLTADPDWVHVQEGFVLAREHEIESLLAISNGYVGTRGSLEEGSPISAPATFIAGVFDQAPTAGAIPELAVAPDWLHVRMTVHGKELKLGTDGDLDHRRILDFRQGILWREWLHRDSEGRLTRIRSMRLVSLADRHVLAQSVALTPVNYGGRLSIEARLALPVDRPDRIELPLVEATALGARGLVIGRALEMRTQTTGVTVAFASGGRLWSAKDSSARTSSAGEGAESWEIDVEMERTYRLDRLVLVYTSRDVANPKETAVARLETLLEGGVERVLSAHRDAWKDRWEAADIEVLGDSEAQRALRFAGYHLIGAADPENEMVSIGARALTGEGYKGHFFWDTELFMLPFYIFTHPPSARGLLLYRYYTLPAAREKARRLGFQGALYAWESALSGEEETPPYVIGPEGEVLRVLSGEQEHHISADVAYAVWLYWKATEDHVFLREYGAEILLDTARFWASRGTCDAGGRYHIPRVMGPDEYHENVDDNAYTNVMAQWNLEAAADAADFLRARWPDRWRDLARDLKLAEGSPDEWRATARRMYTGYDEESSLYEQFAGYFGGEEVDLGQYADRTMPIDMLLGRERTQRSKVVKQADVVMLLALLWERLPPAVREVNFRYYEPRTGHGSSLSPAIHALVAAKLGDTELALRYFRQAAEIDLSNRMGNAAMGVHAASLGGLWMAAVFGFGGVGLQEGGIHLDPHLPPGWRSLRFPFQWRGRHLEVRIEPPFVEVSSHGGDPVEITLGDESPRMVARGSPARAKIQGIRRGAA